MPTDAAITIRAETATDYDSIGALTQRAFAGMPYADGSEPRIIERLRAMAALELSLVAIRHGHIVGHVAFSPASNAGGLDGWFALGPISVESSLQRQGIARALIESGFRILKERGARGCILVGDPAFYGRFGFRLSPDHCPPGLPADYFMIASFGEIPEGTFAFHPAFSGDVPRS